MDKTTKHDSKKKTRRAGQDLAEKVNFKLIEKYAGLGLIDEEIGIIFDVTRRTIENWKKDPRFLSALQRGKLKADAKVVESLYKRACGYSHPAVKIFQYEGQIVQQEYIEHWPPDTLACNSWLNNRRRHQWQWQPKAATGLEDEQIERLRKLAIGAMDEAT